MWADLVRRAEPEFATGPAIMLTLAALQAGDGALAAIAVQRALQADPSDRLANLLAQAVAEGIDPATVTKLLAG
jgi:Tfp pilus assembly protein PilF